MPMAAPPPPLPAHTLTDPTEIRWRMARDWARLIAKAGPDCVVPTVALLDFGWSPAQLDDHAGAAQDLAYTHPLKPEAGQ